VIGLMTQQAIDAQNAQIMKAADPVRQPRTPAHSAAEGGMSAGNSRPDSEDPGHHDPGEDDDEDAEKSFRPYIAGGHAAESPSNEPGRPRESGPGEIAAGHEASAGLHAAAMDAQAQAVHLPWQAGVQGDGQMAAQIRDHRPSAQVISRADTTALTQSAAGAPIGSSYSEHAGHVTVAHTGVAPGQPSVHTAPNNTSGQGLRENAPQAASRGGAVYLPGTIGGAF